MAQALPVPTDDDGLPIPVMKLGVVQNFAIAAGAPTRPPNAITSGQQIVRVVATKACYIAFGSDPTAAATTAYIPADVAEYFWIDDADLISAIAAVSGESGICSITEMG